MAIGPDNDPTTHAAIAAAITSLQTIESQATTFQAQAPYGTSNLANLNDLLSKAQTMAGAIKTLAIDLVNLANILTG